MGTKVLNLILTFTFIATTSVYADENQAADPAVAQFLNTPDDRIAFTTMQQSDLSERPELILNSLKATEDLLLKKGWSICEGQVVPSTQTPFGFQFFSKSRLCFYSVSENTGYWLTKFLLDNVTSQSLFYAAVQRLYRSIERSQSAALPRTKPAS